MVVAVVTESLNDPHESFERPLHEHFEHTTVNDINQEYDSSNIGPFVILFVYQNQSFDYNYISVTYIYKKVMTKLRSPCSPSRMLPPASQFFIELARVFHQICLMWRATLLLQIPSSQVFLSKVASKVSWICEKVPIWFLLIISMFSYNIVDRYMFLQEEIVKSWETVFVYFNATFFLCF
jgi:hypothetical protein